MSQPKSIRITFGLAARGGRTTPPPKRVTFTMHDGYVTVGRPDD